ncbi:hypothetical protein ERW49_13315 [Aliivibrio finisterrensis]|uniref:Uncharacterized protein n=1 Tax=Aliivibrio finisterrensis TaxID=511998 RepID=A0A4Q5KJP0_9GAMM|nr:hypothetical protein [Aliivibrio finisterrensis]RYU45716.1 hypothetical protein ERW49_13315 [Aliivibrio finisterrensis]
MTSNAYVSIPRTKSVHIKKTMITKLKFSTMILIVLSIYASNIYASDDWGYIVKDHYDCENDHMAINTDKGWLLAEAYNPYSVLQSGAYIKGNLRKYGYQQVLVFRNENDSSPRKAKIYIDNYWMSEEDAAQYCFSGEDL